MAVAQTEIVTYPYWSVTVLWTQHCAGSDTVTPSGGWYDARRRRWVPARPLEAIPDCVPAGWIDLRALRPSTIIYDSPRAPLRWMALPVRRRPRPRRAIWANISRTRRVVAEEAA